MWPKLLRPVLVGAALVLPIFLAPTTGVASVPLESSARTVIVATNAYGDIDMVRYDQPAIESSLSMSWRHFPEQADTVYLVNPNDAFVSAGISVAGKSQRPGPVLFTDAEGGLNERIRAEIGRLHPRTIVAVGGQGSVMAEALEEAREAAQVSHDNFSGAGKVVVQTQTWDGQDGVHSSIVIGQHLFPQSPEWVYIVDADESEANVVALSAVAGSIGKGPVFMVNDATANEVRDAIEQMNPQYVVGMGQVPTDIVSKVAGKRMKSSVTGSSITSIALNAASTRHVDATATSTVVAVDDPASLILAAGTVRGPLIPLIPETTMEQVVNTMATANKLTGASSQRFVAIGKEGDRSRIFEPQVAQTLSGGLTSTDVIGKGIGTPEVEPVPDRLTAGKGEPFKYTIEVDQGLPVDGAEFAREVSATLNDARGWGRNFTQVADRNQAHTRIVLASPDLVDKLCGVLPSEGKASCHNNKVIAINVERWAYGASPFLQAGGNLNEYRHYLINHEVGYVLGNAQENCAGKGKQASVMMPQTVDLKGCKPNPWPGVSGK